MDRATCAFFCFQPGKGGVVRSRGFPQSKGARVDVSSSIVEGAGGLVWRLDCSEIFFGLGLDWIEKR